MATCGLFVATREVPPVVTQGCGSIGSSRPRGLIQQNPKSELSPSEAVTRDFGLLSWHLQGFGRVWK